MAGDDWETLPGPFVGHITKKMNERPARGDTLACFVMALENTRQEPEWHWDHHL